jgi:hypothetical protein
MPDQDPFAAIARPIVPPKANADPYASIAKPIDPYASIAKPINFDDLGGKRVSGPSTSSHQSGGIDFSDLGGRRVGTVPIPQGATLQPLHHPSHRSVPIPQGATLQPLNSGTEDPFAGIAKPIDDPYAGIAKPIDQASASSDDQPGVLARTGKSFAQGLGIPTSKAELEAAQPSTIEKIVGPAATAGKMGLNYVKNLYHQGKESASEIGDAITNVREGQPVGENLGKAGAAASDFALKGVLAPVGGSALSAYGEDIAAGKYPEAVGHGAAAAVNAVAAHDLVKGDPPKVGDPIPGAPLTPGEAAGPGVLRSGEQLVSKVGSAQKPVRDFMENRTAAIKSAAHDIAPSIPPEIAGADVQNAARSVVQNKENASQLVDQFADHAKDNLDATKAAAEDAKQATTQAESERQGREMQDTAAQEIDKRRAASISNADEIAKSISGGHEELPVPEADRKIIETLRDRNQSAKAEESAAHNQLTAAAKDRGVVVDTKPMQEVAQSVVKLEGPARDLVTSSLPSGVLKMLEKASEGESANSPLDPYAQAMTGHNYTELKGLAESPPSGKASTRGAGGTDWKGALEQVETEAAKSGIQPMESGVPYDIMKTGRTAVREALQGSRKHFQQTGMGGNSVRVLQDLYGSMTDAMKKSLEPHADLTEQFNQANGLTVDRTSKFVDPKFIRQLVYKGDASKVVGAVMRSGGQTGAESLVNALGGDTLAIGPLKRAAMDFTLRRSMKSMTGDMPGTVESGKIDYDLAVRNAERTPALRTILGDASYQKFVDSLEEKRLAARDPDEVRFDGYLQRVAKAESPEKASKFGADQGNLSRLAQSNPEVNPRPIDTGAGDRAVAQAESRLAGAKSASEKVNSPSMGEKGVQKVAKSVSEDLTPSGIIERAAKEPEYTSKLLDVIDKAPNPQQVRQQLGERIFRNATDNAMVDGAFGSNEGIFDVGKFQSDYQASRASLAKILPQANVQAMDEFAQSLKQYSLSNGVGQAGGISSRMLLMRQIMAVPVTIGAALMGHPVIAAAGIGVLNGPKIWMELATHPEAMNVVSAALNSVGKTMDAGIIATSASKKGQESQPSTQGTTTNTDSNTKSQTSPLINLERLNSSRNDAADSNTSARTMASAPRATKQTITNSATPAANSNPNITASPSSRPTSAPAFTVPKGAEKHNPVTEYSQLRDARTKKVYASATRDAGGKLVWGPPQ